MSLHHGGTESTGDHGEKRRVGDLQRGGSFETGPALMRWLQTPVRGPLCPSCLRGEAFAPYRFTASVSPSAIVSIAIDTRSSRCRKSFSARMALVLAS